jgi:uncharacterized protein (TIGR00725 family)
LPLIAVLGSSLPAAGEPAYEEAREVGREIGRRAAGVLCGGYSGVMEAACRGASEAGAEAVGVLLAGRAEPNPWVTRRLVAADLASRLRFLRDEPAGWIFLPRGLGTMLELVWIAESVVKGETRARPLVFIGGYWKETLQRILGEAAGPGAESLARCARFAESPEEAVEAVLASGP